MGFVTVNYSLNQTFFVEKSAFENIVKKANSNAKLSKITSFDVDVSEIKNDFTVNMEILIKKDATYVEALGEIQSLIETYSMNVIDSKPENISMVVKGEF